MSIFQFFSPISQNLINILNSPEPDIIEILSEPTCVRAFQSNNEDLVHFFLSHLQQLIDICFNLDNPSLSTKAYNILSQENITLNTNLLKEHLSNISDDIFEKEDPILINRFAKITKNSCLALPSSMFDFCSDFLAQFIDYISEPEVYDMFYSFFVNENTAPLFLTRDFQNNFVSAIESAPSEFSSEFGDRNIPQVVGLFKIISQIYKINIKSEQFFKSAILTPTNIQILARSFDDSYVSLLDAQYSALQQLCVDQPSSFLFLMPKLLEFLSFSPDETYFHEYQTCSIRIITSFLKTEFSGTVPNFLINEKLPSQLLMEINIFEKFIQIIKQFPGHTIASSAISDFILTIFSQKTKLPLQENIVSLFVPFLNEILCTSKRFEQKAFAWNLLTEILKIDETIKQSLNQEANHLLEHLTSLSEANYGGEIPEKPVYDEENISLTPEKLLLLLNLLKGAR